MWQTIIDELTGTFSVVPPEIATLRLTIAILLGGIVGFEREMRHKPAGLRTHMLISMAACLFILVGHELTELSFGDAGEIRTDPLRLIEAVTSGVAFLAAGAIFTMQGRVKNLTTGASMWLAGAIGLSCGAGRVPLALIATIIALIVLAIVNRLEPDHATGEE